MFDPYKPNWWESPWLKDLGFVCIVSGSHFLIAHKDAPDLSDKWVLSCGETRKDAWLAVLDLTEEDVERTFNDIEVKPPHSNA